MVKVKNTAALELKETRFLRWLHMSCRLHLYRFYVGESIISRIISDLNFPPLCQNLSRKCKQTWINPSPKFVFSLRCSISSELWEPLNKRIYTEESRKYYATPITSLPHQSRHFNQSVSLYYNDVNITWKDKSLGTDTQKSQFPFDAVQFSTRSRSGRMAENP